MIEIEMSLVVNNMLLLCRLSSKKDSVYTDKVFFLSLPLYYPPAFFSGKPILLLLVSPFHVLIRSDGRIHFIVESCF